MNIIHFSDTHLGYSDLEFVDSNGINQREADFYKAFSDVVDSILETKPDFVVHTGDLFHRASPSNRAITFALSEFGRLNSAKIPTIIIAGNHSTPRSIQTASILKIFDNFDYIYANYSQSYERFEFDDIVFHTLSHINDSSKADEEIKKCENIDKNKKNIMLLHASVGASYLMSEFGEWVYPSELEYIFESMDYVGLGHWHKFGNVKKYPNVYYSGSTERTSLNDKSNQKGYVQISLDDSLSIEYKQIQIREVVSVEIDCKEYLANTMNLQNYPNAIVDVTLKNLTPTQSLDIKNSDIREMFCDSLYVNIKREIENSESKSYSDISAISLEEFFLEQIKKECDSSEYERLRDRVIELFGEVDDTN